MQTPINVWPFAFGCVCLVFGLFGAPNNITGWVEVAEISHGNTCTSAATTRKYTYIFMHVCYVNWMQWKPEIQWNMSTVKKPPFFEALHFLSGFETLNTPMFFTSFYFQDLSFMLSPLFFPPSGKCRDIGRVLMCFDHLSHLLLFSRQKKKSWKTGKSYMKYRS